VPPPDAKWAKGRKTKEAGDPANPMQLVKIFFKEPDAIDRGETRTVMLPQKVEMIISN
jgi:hypothetical protein